MSLGTWRFKSSLAYQGKNPVIGRIFALEAREDLNRGCVTASGGYDPPCFLKTVFLEKQSAYQGKIPGFLPFGKMLPSDQEKSKSSLGL